MKPYSLGTETERNSTSTPYPLNTHTDTERIIVIKREKYYDKDKQTASDSLLSEPPGKSPRMSEGVVCHFYGGVPDQGFQLGSPASQADSLPAVLPGKPR